MDNVTEHQTSVEDPALSLAEATGIEGGSASAEVTQAKGAPATAEDTHIECEPGTSKEMHAKDKPGTAEATGIEGGLGAVKGLRVTGVSAGLRRNPNRRDLALIVAEPGSRAAGVFTQNVFAAAPVALSRQHLEEQAQGAGFRALIINSGNANAATGEQGKVTAKEISKITAQAIDCEAEQVLVASTGVIGAQLSPGPFEAGVAKALAQINEQSGQAVAGDLVASVMTTAKVDSVAQTGDLAASVMTTDKLDSAAQAKSQAVQSRTSAKTGSAAQAGGLAAAEAIMTTDTVPKMAARSFSVKQPDGSEASFTVGGMAKGSGMIAPHMATMIAVMATDATLAQEDLQQALSQAVQVSFNKVTIDSDTSTNDSAYLIATGAVPGEALQTGSPGYAAFTATLTEVCQDLAYQIARDGEGATKVIVVDVIGAATGEDAECAARAIADSPLVKTAVAGHDANWGRIAMAAGKSGATFKPENVSISIMGLPVLYKGAPQEFSEQEALRLFEERDEVHIIADLGAGRENTRMWTCDLTKEYVAINGDYRT